MARRDFRDARWKVAGHVLAMTCLGVLVACGGGDGANPVSPTPVAVTRVLQEGGFRLDPAEDDHVHFALFSVTDATAGRWQATVDWTAASSELWMYVANGVCTVEQFAAPECPFEASCACQFVLRSETNVPKPRVLTIAQAPGGTRTVIVMNLSPQSESGSYQVTLTPSAGLEAGDSGTIRSARGGAALVATGIKGRPTLRGRR